MRLHSQVVQDTVALLVSSMQEWIDIIEAEAPTDSMQSPQAFASLPRLEGCALGLLCSTSVKTRRFALELARKARDLHGVLSHRYSVNVWRSDGAPSSRSEPGSASGKGRGTPGATSIFLADVIDRYVAIPGALVRRALPLACSTVCSPEPLLASRSASRSLLFPSHRLSTATSFPAPLRFWPGLET